MVFVNLLGSPGIDPSMAGRYINPVCRTGPPGGVDSSESIPELHERLQVRAQEDKNIID